MHTVLAALALAARTAPEAAVAPEPLRITHEAVRCVMAERFPVLDACVEPAQRVGRVRAYFRADHAPAWHFVEMQPLGECYRGRLPQPRRSTRRVAYYLVASDLLAGEARSPEVSAQVVGDEAACTAGALGPFLSSAAVIVGGRGLPAGFVGAGSGSGAAKKAAAAVLGGGAIAGGVLLAAGRGAAAPGDGTGGTGGPTTTAPAPAPTTTTTTTRPPDPTTTTTRPPAPTTTTTTQPSVCALDVTPPTVRIEKPASNAEVGTRVEIVVDARDLGAGASGMREVRLYALKVGGTAVAIATLTGPGPSYKTTWSAPACVSEQERWDIAAEARDNCGNAATATVRVRRKDCDGGGAQAATTAPALAWASELDVPGGSGQVVANGTDVAFAPERRSSLQLPARRGANRIEAVLVDAQGRPGSWSFTLGSGALRPGSVRVLAGEVLAISGETVTFRMRGRPGERVVFAYQVD